MTIFGGFQPPILRRCKPLGVGVPPSTPGLASPRLWDVSAKRDGSWLLPTMGTDSPFRLLCIYIYIVYIYIYIYIYTYIYIIYVYVYIYIYTMWLVDLHNRDRFAMNIPSGHQTWLLNISRNGDLNGKINYKWWIFHCYIKKYQRVDPYTKLAFPPLNMTIKSYTIKAIYTS